MPVRPRPPRPDVAPRPDDSTRPDLNPRLSEKQLLDQFRRQVANYPQWDSRRYQTAVAGSFDRMVNNNSDYMTAIYDAASQNKPVVLFIGKGSDPASRQVIENSLKQSRGRNGRDAVYAFVDLDRVDKNSSIAKYASENMPRKGQEPPFTMVFGLSRGDASNPVKADGPSFYKMGALDSGAVSEAVSRLKLQMEGRFNIQRPSDQSSRPGDQSPRPNDWSRPNDQVPRPTPLPDQPVNPLQLDPRVQEAFTKSILQAQQTTDKEGSYKAYKNAIDIADYAKNPLLQSAARVELGLACLKWGHTETGLKWIMDGGAKNPDLYNNQKNAPFRERLSQAGVPRGTVDLLILNGQRDPNWFNKTPDAAKLLESSMSTPVRPAPPIVIPVAPVVPRPSVIPDRTLPNIHIKPSPFNR